MGVSQRKCQFDILVALYLATMVIGDAYVVNILINQLFDLHLQSCFGASKSNLYLNYDADGAIEFGVEESVEDSLMTAWQPLNNSISDDIYGKCFRGIVRLNGLL